eukprot:4542273-Pyramimonas_sp.AAC.1
MAAVRLGMPTASVAVGLVAWAPCMPPAAWGPGKGMFSTRILEDGGSSSPNEEEASFMSSRSSWTPIWTISCPAVHVSPASVRSARAPCTPHVHG